MICINDTSTTSVTRCIPRIINILLNENPVIAIYRVYSIINKLIMDNFNDAVDSIKIMENGIEIIERVNRVDLINCRKSIMLMYNQNGLILGQS